MKVNSRFRFLFHVYFILLTACANTSAEKNNGVSVSKNDIEGSTKGSKDYFVGFFGERTSVVDLQIGHVFIGIGKGIPLTCDLNGTETEMFGFYPKAHVEGGKSLWAGPVDGQIKNDVRTRIDSYVFKKITFDEYIKVKLKMEEWQKKRYELIRNDCISFFQDVAKLFNDIKLPDRNTFVTPETYLSQFMAINKILN